MDETRTTIRLPAGLHDRVRRLAGTDRRSVHAELLWLIERALDEEDKIREEGQRSR
jgi:predicted transcriptional regulator